jgi:small subunit ribosomal protein S6
MAKNKSSQTPHYELLYIVSNQFTEDEVKPIVEEVKAIIEKHDGKVTYDEYWGKKELAYPINHFNHGYYALYEFDASGEKMTQIDKDLRMNRKVLRHQIVSKVFRTPEEIAAEKQAEQEKTEKMREEKAKEEKEEKEEVKKEEKKEKKEDKVNLKELDEKLDKILETDDLL